MSWYRTFVSGLGIVAAGASATLEVRAAEVLEEVTVTAQRRSESIQDVPISITAFTGETLAELGLKRPLDIGFTVPGVTVKSVNGDNSPLFTIRGVGLAEFSVSNNSPTTVYVNGVVKPYFPMLNFSLFDAERVEILKGPQGTLYGRNNTAGAINYITKAPTFEPEGFLRADYGRYDTLDVEGGYGTALSDDLAFRASGTLRRRWGGYQYNRFTESENGEIEKFAGRLQFLFEPTDNVSINFDVHGGANNSDVPLFKLAPPFDVNAPGTVCAAAERGERARDGSCVDAIGQFDPVEDVHSVNAGNVQGFGIDEDAWGFALSVDIDLGWSVLTSITGYDELERQEFQDFDASPAILVDNMFRNDINAFSQELRLASTAGSGLDWVAGLYYSTDELDNLQAIRADDLFGTPNGTVNVDWVMETMSYAAFGQVTMPLTERLSLTGGLRYTYEERDFVGGTRPDNIPFLPVIYVDNTTDVDDLSGKLVLDFQMNDDLMLYLSGSTGFKSGGYNGAFATNPLAYEPYGPEDILAVETGLKSTLLDGRAQLNLAAYSYWWQDFQASVQRTDPVTNIPVQILTNAGDAEILGIEASLLVRPVDGLDISLAMNFIDGEVVDGDFEGEELANNPDFSLSGVIRYEAPVTDAYNGFASLDFNYRTDYDTQLRSPATRELVRQDAFALMNARVGIKAQDGGMEFSLWVRNLTDEEYLLEVFDQGTINTVDLWAEPRTYGVSLGLNF